MTLFLRPLVAFIRSVPVIVSLALLVLPRNGWAEDEESRSKVTAAAQRLLEQSYRWETRVSSADPDTPGSETSRPAGSGRQGPNGYVYVDGVLSNSDTTFAIKDRKVAILLDGNWMTLEQAEERNPRSGRRGRRGFRFGNRGRSLGETVSKFQTPAVMAISLLRSASGF